MSNLWDRILLVPSVVRLASQAPRNPHAAWETYWRGISATGRSGDVLWDSDSLTERSQFTETLVTHFDPALPVIDVGCGNGTQTRWLADLFPSVLGVDVSTAAVERAKRETEGIPNVDFMVLDAASAGAGRRLLERLGPANVFVRGVFHVLKSDKQADVAENLRTIVGSSGRVFLAETNFRGTSLAYLEQLGATRRSIPRQLRRALENLPRPGHFGGRERRNVFPAANWKLIADGPANIEVVPMTSTAHSQQVPGYFAVLAGVKEPGPGNERL